MLTSISLFHAYSEIIVVCVVSSVVIYIYNFFFIFISFVTFILYSHLLPHSSSSWGTFLGDKLEASDSSKLCQKQMTSIVLKGVDL